MLLGHDDQLYRLIDGSAGDVWLVMRAAAYKRPDPLESSPPQLYSLVPEFTSQDGRLALYRMSTSAPGGTTPRQHASLNRPKPARYLSSLPFCEPPRDFRRRRWLSQAAMA
jgi:hypothetical protein